MTKLSGLTHRPWLWASVAANGIIGCAWPLLASNHYQAITGRKTDMWLTSTISLQLGVSTSVMTSAGIANRVTPEVATMAIGSSMAMAGLSLVNRMRGRIPPVYLVDAVGHLGLVTGWLLGVRRPGALQREVGARPRGMSTLVSLGQVGYFALGSLWPLLGDKSFQWVTGPKQDMWLVDGVALLLGVDAIVIGQACRNNRLTPEIAMLGGGASAALAGVGIVNVVRGRISRVYLLDASVHVAFVAGWLVAWGREHATTGRPFVDSLPGDVSSPA